MTSRIPDQPSATDLGEPAKQDEKPTDGVVHNVVEEPDEDSEDYKDDDENEDDDKDVGGGD